MKKAGNFQLREPWSFK